MWMWVWQKVGAGNCCDGREGIVGPARCGNLGFVFVTEEGVVAAALVVGLGLIG